MKSNRKEHSRFVQWLDRTAEKNPVLWLPCVVLLVIALGAENICGIVGTAFPRREKICVSDGKADVQLVRKPFALRVVAMTLVLSFVFMTVPEFGQFVSADEYYSEPMTDWQNDINVTGNNSFGNMLADEFSEKSSEQQENNGYNVFSVEMQGNTAVVDYEAVNSSTLVVGIYDESGGQLLTTGSIEVTADEDRAIVDLDSTKIPQYFYIKAYLINTETMRPLCTVYECPTYTQEMQEFLSKTVNDFDPDRVLNLDSDMTNNFAVFSDDAVITEESADKNNVVSVDNDNNIYVIENADDIVKDLQNGDVFSHEYGSNEVLIVKVNTVSIVGDTVTIYGDDSSLEDVFEYVKIDTSAYTEDAVIDSSNLEDGIIDNGFKAISNSEPQTYALDVTGGDNYARSFEFANKEVEEDGDKANINGTVDVSIESYAKLYVSWGETYVELKLDYKAIFNFEFSGSVNKSFEVAHFRFSPLPCLNIELTPKIILKFNINLKIHGELYGSVGYRCSTDTGMTNISSKPKFKSEIKLDGSFYLGISLDPTITVIHEKVANLGLNGTLGVQVNVSSEWSTEQGEDKKHECNVCIGGDIYAQYSLHFHVKFFNSDRLKYEKDIINESVKVFDYYASATFGDFGLTKCPHVLYRVNINVVDTNLKKADNAVITVSNGEKYTTDGNGEAILYLHNGSYGIDVTKDKSGSARRMFNISNKPQDLTVYLKSGDTISGELGNSMVKQISTGYFFSAALTINGDLYTWGSNIYGGLGDGTDYSRSYPVKIMENVLKVELGHSHSAAIKENGDLYIWGNNSWGELGYGYSGGFGSFNPTPQKIMENVKDVSLGYFHSAAITTDGDLYMWGQNMYGEIGKGANGDQYTPIKVLSDVIYVDLGDDNSAAITSDGDLYLWGYCKRWQFEDGSNELYVYTPKKLMSNISQVSMNGAWCSALTTNGDLYTWGDNLNYGWLGNGTNQDSNIPIKIMEDVVYISGASAITSNGDLYTWGSMKDYLAMEQITIIAPIHQK